MSKKIIIVEDIAVIAEDIKNTLLFHYKNKKNLDIEIVDSAEKCIEKFLNNNDNDYCCVIIDILLEGNILPIKKFLHNNNDGNNKVGESTIINSIRLADQINKNYKNSNIIFLSCLDPKDIIKQYHRNLNDIKYLAYINKPYDPIILFNSIDKVISN